MKFKNVLAGLFLLAGIGLLASACAPLFQSRWSDEELAALRTLWIGSLKPLPADPSNQYADNSDAAVLGQKLFFDTRFSANGKVACGTCHLPDQFFQDGTPLASGMGTTNRRTMTIIGTAYSPWLFWDGRKDSQWAQALGPLESPVEHGSNRTYYAHMIDKYYRAEYESIFGEMPEVSQLPVLTGSVQSPEVIAAWEEMSAEDRENVTRIYVNMGKAIAAYERHLLPGESRFDRYVEAILDGEYETASTILTSEEIAGLKLFIGPANCTDCHNGPLFTNNDFHNTGVPIAPDLPDDVGRAMGVQQVVTDEFNCMSVYSDAEAADCAELRFLVTAGHELERQFKPPSLRGVADRGPFMHAGQFATLEEVLQHYNTAPEAPAGHSELEPLNLSQEQLAQIIAFLKTLDSPVNAEETWLRPPQYSN